MTPAGDHPDDRDVEVLAHVTDHLVATVAEITDDRWHDPTPCDAWDVRDLVDHVTGGNWFTIEILGGRSAEEAMATTMARFGGGSPGVADIQRSARDQRDAFQRPGALDGTWSHVAGELTGREILRIRLHDLVIHGWDLDRGLGSPDPLTGDLARWGLAELADPGSPTAAHFGITTSTIAADQPDPAAAYLACFGRSG